MRTKRKEQRIGREARTIKARLIEPGRHVDPIPPSVLADREVALSAALGAIEIDVPAKRPVWHRVGHEFRDGLFRPVFSDARIKHLPPATAVVAGEPVPGAFSAARSAPAADVWTFGVEITRLLEATTRSAGATGPQRSPGGVAMTTDRSSDFIKPLGEHGPEAEIRTVPHRLCRPLTAFEQAHPRQRREAPRGVRTTPAPGSRYPYRPDPR